MPYSGKDDDSLPSNVKAMPDNVRAQWVKVFNSTYQSCVDNGGDSSECEGKAFRYANGVAKKQMEQEGALEYGFVFCDLQAALTDGKLFDGMTSGIFWDMYGRKVTIKSSDMKEYLKNTLKAIEFTKTEQGDVIGLPIDCEGHDKGDGAGWIVDASIEDVTKPDGKTIKVLRFMAKWTEIGKDLIEKGIRRMFSPTVDTEAKVVLGGSLTNWPATRDKIGNVLLRPIEMEVGFRGWELADNESLDEKTSQVRDAFRAAFNPDSNIEKAAPYNYIVEVFADFAVVNKDGEYYKVSYSDSDDGIEFSQESEWVKVKRSWVEAQLNPGDQTNVSEANIMAIEMTQEELANFIGEAVKNQLSEVVQFQLAELVKKPSGEPKGDPGDDGGDAGQVDWLKFFDMTDMQDKTVQATKEQMLAAYEQMQKRAAQEAAELIAKIKRGSIIKEEANFMVGGRQDAPVGIPSSADALEKFMTGLDDGQLKFFTDLMAHIQTNGLVQFEELGHNRQAKGTTPLPEYYAQKLDAGEMTLADLKNPILASDLGDLGRYDLSKWQK